MSRRDNHAPKGRGHSVPRGFHGRCLIPWSEYPTTGQLLLGTILLGVSGRVPIL